MTNFQAEAADLKLSHLAPTQSAVKKKKEFIAQCIMKMLSLKLMNAYVEGEVQ